MFWLLLGLSLLLFVFWAYRFNKTKYSYWKERGVPYAKPLPFFGNIFKVAMFMQRQGDCYNELYNNYKNEKYVGIYEMIEPALLIRDPEVIGKILVKDFAHFSDRDVAIGPDDIEVDSNLFNMKGIEWRGIRFKMSPAFSTGKLKTMFKHMLTCAESFKKNLQISNEQVDMKEYTTMFSLDIIANCVFGVDIAEDRNRNSKFRKMGRKFFELTPWRYITFLLVTTQPKIAEKLGMSFTPKDVSQYFAKIIKDTFSIREKSNIQRNDFIQMLLQLREKGCIEVASKDPEDDYLDLDKESFDTLEITEKMLISQAFVFLTAGFDGISMTVLFILFELARNKEVQDRLRQEIQDQIEEHNGLNYDAVKEMKFLDKCVNESLRMYPLAPFLIRECTKTYNLDGLVLEKGSKVVIPNHALQMDPEIFPEPETFNPDRFESDITTSINNFNNLPFGAGPRMCIGMRFALIVVKLAVVCAVQDYDLSLSPLTKLPVKLRIQSLITAPVEDILFNIKKIK